MSTHKETSCFQTGLWAEMREPSICESCDLPEPNEEDGVACALPRALPPLPARPFAFALLLIAPRADKAVDEGLRERVLVATPLTSLSSSPVGSRETNSFCSNWTTT